MRSIVGASPGGAFGALLAASNFCQTHASPVLATNETVLLDPHPSASLVSPSLLLLHARHWSVPATTDTQTVVETDVAISRTTVVEVVPITLTPSGTTITTTSHETIVSDVTETEISYSPVIVGTGTTTDQPLIITDQPSCTSTSVPQPGDTIPAYCPTGTVYQTRHYPGVWTIYEPAYLTQRSYSTGPICYTTGTTATTDGCEATIVEEITAKVTATLLPESSDPDQNAANSLGHGSEAGLWAAGIASGAGILLAL